jgi:hypothetical protein
MPEGRLGEISFQGVLSAQRCSLSSPNSNIQPRPNDYHFPFAPKFSDSWTPFVARNELLAYLEHFAPLNRGFLETPGGILAIDTSSYLYVMNSEVGLEACRELIWKEVNGVWDARVEAFVDDMANDPLATRLIEGVLLHGRENVLFVLAQAKYDPTRQVKSVRINIAIFRYGYVVLFLLKFGATDSGQKFE